MSRATIPSATLYLALVLAAGQQVLAANDWSIPCIQGQCSWDIPTDSGASGTVHLTLLMVQPKPTERLTFLPSGAVTFSGNPDVGATLAVTGHLIPQLELGLTALGGVASAGVFANLDASAGVTVATSTASDAQTCVNADTTLDVGIGAEDTFLGLFDDSVRKSLFSTTFPLLQNKCFGGSDSNSSSTPDAAAGARRRDARPEQVFYAPRGGSVLPLYTRQLNLACPSISSLAKVALNELIP